MEPILHDEARQLWFEMAEDRWLESEAEYLKWQGDPLGCLPPCDEEEIVGPFQERPLIDYPPAPLRGVDPTKEDQLPF